MWKQYRKFKHLVVPAVIVLAAFLLRGTPQASLAWSAVLAVAVLMAVAYLAEEALWMRRGRGRPCPKCGEMIPVKSFRLRNQCAHCGHLL